MTPDELRRMDNDLCIIFVKGLRPIKADKFYYFKHPMAKQLAECEISHNDIGEIERGVWRKYNPYNPYVPEEDKEKKAEDLKIESLDDLFEEDEKDTAKVAKNDASIDVLDSIKSDSINIEESEESEESEKIDKIQSEDEEYDLQKELEAKFDELFGPIDED